MEAGQPGLDNGQEQWLEPGHKGLTLDYYATSSLDKTLQNKPCVLFCNRKQQEHGNMEKETSSLNFAWQEQTPYTKLLHSNRALDSTKAYQVKVVTKKMATKT